MSFSKKYRARFKLNDGRTGKTSIESRLEIGDELLIAVRAHIAAKSNVQTTEVYVCSIVPEKGN